MASITNQDVIEKERLEGLIPCCQWIRTISNQTLKDTSVRSSVLSLVKKLQNLKKSRSRPGFTEKIDSFKKEPYKFPSVILTSKNKKSKNDIGALNSNMLKSLAENLATDLNKSLEKENELKSENAELKLSYLKKCNLKYKLKACKTQIHEQNNKISCLSRRIKSKSEQMKRLMSQNSYYRKKNTKLETCYMEVRNCNEKLKLKMQDLDNKLKNLQKQFSDEREENEYLRLLINDNINRDIQLFDENKMLYSEQTQECIYELLNNNVTTSRVSPVIETLLKLAGVKANKLPSISTVNNMNVQRLMLSHAHVSNTIAKEDEPCCLLSDETSKYGQKLEGFHLSDSHGKTWVLGLRHCHKIWS